MVFQKAKEKFREILSSLFDKSGTRSNNDTDNSGLEAGGGQRVERGSVESYTRHLWDTPKKLQRVARALQSALRKKEAGRIQPEKGANTERLVGMKRLYQSPDFNIAKEILMEKESSAYFGLRHPETKKEGVSQEYYNGFLNGRLSIIDEFRDAFERAIIILQKKAIEEENKNAGN